MGKKHINQRKTNDESNSTDNSQQQERIVENTAVLEYFDIVKNEYEIERNKKQSFENRAGLVMALLGAICIYIFEYVKLKDIFELMKISITFAGLIEIVSGLAVYGGVIVTIITVMKTIGIRSHNNFEVKNIDETLLTECRLVALCRIIKTYRYIIIQHRELNDKRAKTYKISICGIFVTLISTIIYINLK